MAAALGLGAGMGVASWTGAGATGDSVARTTGTRRPAPAGTLPPPRPTGSTRATGACSADTRTAAYFHLEDAPVRRDVRDGRPGVVMRLDLRVVDAATCRPLAGADVDLWHCDALGAYSGYSPGGERQPGDRRRHLRGRQTTNAGGNVRFVTVVPGWYEDTAAHVGVRVVAGGRVVHTGRLYLPDGFVADVAGRSPYRANRIPRTTAALDRDATGDGLVVSSVDDLARPAVGRATVAVRGTGGRLGGRPLRLGGRDGT
jgi:protocatechuate 3,4-dioxygenase beta subunit